MVTMRATRGGKFGETVFLRRELGFANLTKNLPFISIITVKIRLWSIAERAGTIIRDVAFFTPCNGFDLYVVAVLEVRDKQTPVPFMVIKFDLGEFICFELLVLGRVGIVKSPLLERDISTDKSN